MAVELASGSVFAGYRVDGVVARGGMGVVYCAYDLGLERPVALKLIAPELAGDPRFRERFLRETRIAASLKRPHILPVYGAAEEGSAHQASRYDEGEDLRARLARERCHGAEEALRIVGQIASALDAARQDSVAEDATNAGGAGSPYPEAAAASAIHVPPPLEAPRRSTRT